jgi:hypothetical protein
MGGKLGAQAASRPAEDHRLLLIAIAFDTIGVGPYRSHLDPDFGLQGVMAFDGFSDSKSTVIEVAIVITVILSG